ncbi:hypothetical protein CYLTODRAFT_441821 [Cylindrobasidium torrendii FP15055 ss-10]|uniref:DUF6534 domain-containing protein n=1 Tax=Cylindrobasidium torrendii FP15055 ss-10 TaxID=1314674 RepID=A0A0D7BJM9_9AGAR|nr:hypothetical protein CYLTODRAFT_441821 [Cylindrobasidium torrendii FP15055 ss-10]
MVHWQIAVPEALAGSWLNIIAFTTEICLAVWYYRSGLGAKVHRYGLALLLSIDLAGTIVNMAYAYLTVVTASAGSSPDHNYWPLPASLILTYASACLGQCFFIHRYWTISHKTIVTCFLSLLVLSHIVLSVASATVIFVHSGLEYALGLKLSLIASTICTVTDLIVAAALAWRARGIRAYYASTQNCLHRLAIYSVAYGATTAAVTAMAMILLYTNPKGWQVVFSVQGRVYSITVLVNILFLRQANAQDETFSDAGGVFAEPIVLTPVYYNRETAADRVSDPEDPTWRKTDGSEGHAEAVLHLDIDFKDGESSRDARSLESPPSTPGHRVVGSG